MELNKFLTELENKLFIEAKNAHILLNKLSIENNGEAPKMNENLSDIDYIDMIFIKSTFVLGSLIDDETSKNSDIFALWTNLENLLFYVFVHNETLILNNKTTKFSDFGCLLFVIKKRFKDSKIFHEIIDDWNKYVRINYCHMLTNL